MFGSKRKRGDANRYREVGTIGEGGEATISRSFDASLHRLVAVKRLKSSDAEDQARSAFVREARLVCFLDHPGVAPIYDRFTTPDGKPCYAMKLIQGETLSDRLNYKSGQRPHPLPTPEAVRIATRVAQTLAYAHDHGVLHLDLKPDNVMLGRYGEVFLMDWGNARLFDEGPYRATLGDHTAEESIALLVDEPPDLISGTIHFMSPEQTSRPRDQLGPASDQFSAGVLLYLMLCGHLPFRAKGVPATLQAIRENEPVNVATLNPEVPRRLADICHRCLAKDPADRYPDFHAMLGDLQAFQDAGQGFPTRHLAAGDDVFAEGDEGHDAYAVIAGRVAITKQGNEGVQRLAELGPGEIFGELAILTGQPRSATVTALEDTTLRVMDRPAVEKELEKLAPWVGTMLTTLAERFLGLNEQLVRREQASSENEDGAGDREGPPAP